MSAEDEVLSSVKKEFVEISVVWAKLFVFLLHFVSFHHVITHVLLGAPDHNNAIQAHCYLPRLCSVQEAF